MKITVDISEHTKSLLHREAERLGLSVSEVAEAALTEFLQKKEVLIDLPPLPKFSGGGEMVDVADRDALDEAMKE